VTEQEILLVGGMASVAVAITLGDLLCSLWRHVRRMRQPAPELALGEAAFEGPPSAARREALRRRLAAIQAADGEQ